jgi:hypothetical protein
MQVEMVDLAKAFSSALPVRKMKTRGLKHTE